MKPISRNYPNVFPYFKNCWITLSPSLQTLQEWFSRKLAYLPFQQLTWMTRRCCASSVTTQNHQPGKWYTLVWMQATFYCNTLIINYIKVIEHISDGNCMTSASLVNQESSTSAFWCKYMYGSEEWEWKVSPQAIQLVPGSVNISRLTIISEVLPK